MSGGGPMAVYLYLLGRHADALRVSTGAGELVLPRAHRLPLRALREAARAGGYLAVCPWVETADGHALVALWTYAQGHERAVAALPADLAPQAIVHAPVGARLLWILAAPYPEAPAGRPTSPGNDPCGARRGAGHDPRKSRRHAAGARSRRGPRDSRS